jgi:hypothetical protein
MREDVGLGGAVPLQDDRVLFGDCSDFGAPRAGGTTAEDDGETSHVAILRVRSRFGPHSGRKDDRGYLDLL